MPNILLIHAKLYHTGAAVHENVKGNLDNCSAGQLRDGCQVFADPSWFWFVSCQSDRSPMIRFVERFSNQRLQGCPVSYKPLA